VIYEDIFEAIRPFAPRELLNLKDRAGQGRLIRHLAFEAIDTGEGDMVLLPRTGLNIMFYRGQGDASWPAVPSIYRGATPWSLLLDRIRMIDFTMAAERFPQVRQARNQGVRVDTLALAQHYGLRTDMLDLTSDLAVAAFFATTELRGGTFYPIETGIGSISGTLFMMGLEGEEHFRPVGLQPFLRPGKQCAFGVKLEEGQRLEDLRSGWSVQFRQNAACGQAFLDLFGPGLPNELFPQEQIAQVADRIRRANIVTQAAVDAYCEQWGASRAGTAEELKERGVTVSKKPVFAPTAKQLGQERIKVLRDGAFGGEIVLSRLMYLPEGSQ